jgi:hypothetical protein
MKWEDDNEWRVGNDLEGDSRGVFQGYIPAFVCTDWINQGKTRKPGQDSNCEPAEYKARTAAPT